MGDVISLKTYRDFKVAVRIDCDNQVWNEGARILQPSQQEIEAPIPVEPAQPKRARKKTERRQIGSMLWCPRLKLWKGCNGKCTFHPETFVAKSYGWWNVVERIDDKVVFNSFRYSVTTSGHQRALRSLLEELGIEIDYEVHARGGLQKLDSAISAYEFEIADLTAATLKPRSRPEKNRERPREIKRLYGQIAVVRKLMKLRSKAGAA